MTIVWPRLILPPQQPMFHVTPMNISGPVSGSGASDVIAGDAGFWRATFGAVVVTTPERVITWNAIDAMTEGRLYPILVPYCGKYQPYPLDPTGNQIRPSGVRHSDDTDFSDDTDYLSSVITVRLMGALPSHAVTGNVKIFYAGQLQAGQVFSFGERMYKLKRVAYTSATTATVSWSPPLREAVEDGAELNFDDPACRMRLASDTEMQLQLDMGERAFPTVNFVEDLLS